MSKGLTLETRPVPLTRLENGVIRVTGTRIPLERVIGCYKEGLTPEAIVESYDTLHLSDVYLVIGYYLDNKEEVEEYLRVQEEEAEKVRRVIEATQPPRPGLKEELLARWDRLGKDDAPPDR